ncbi:MAG TPA: hypothetical protein VL754_04810 [Verrucomicrobiae bacterium]|jgi:hypothetical protein|nr:hypothetical protein [Verrucomicrobiae bacterium]
MLPLLFILIVIAALLILIPGLRERAIEAIKSISDAWLLGFLIRTSRFGSELTDEGRAEQVRWREQRMRNLRGLAVRAKSRHRSSAKQEQSSE